MKTLMRVASVAALIILFAVPVFAELPVVYVDYISRSVSEEVSLYFLPSGAGESLTEASLYGGQPVDAGIHIRLVDAVNIPIANYPFEDIWIESEGGTNSVCIPFPVPLRADRNSDIDGTTEITGEFEGGGWTEGPFFLYRNGEKAFAIGFVEHPPVLMRYNSADINADGLVNLTDIPMFAADFFGDYHYRSDFFWDGVVDLSDLVKFAQGLGHGCQ